MSQLDFFDSSPSSFLEGKDTELGNETCNTNDPRSHSHPYLRHERRLWQAGFRFVAGVDEVGRGPLAGPVVACCCLLPIHRVFPEIQDSKVLSADERQKIYEELIHNPQVIWSVAVIDHQMIDKINILRATLLAMKQAVEALSQAPDFVLVDGRDCPPLTMPCHALIKGDQSSQSIAAGSILAKVVRDRHMDEMHLLYPQYGFDQHKGYGTAGHLKAIEKYGICPIHRCSFAPVSKRVGVDKDMSSDLYLF